MRPKNAIEWKRLRPAVFPFSCLVVGTIVGAWIFGQGSGASGQSQPTETSVLDEVDECDLLAADPSDPQRVSEGVADNAIIPRLAVRACEIASQRRSDELRFAFQLARALIAANRAPAANAFLERAARGQYAAAIATLADRRAEAADVNPSALVRERLNAARAALREAAAMHEQAFRGGYGPSEQRRIALSFDGAIYSEAILGQIAEGAFDAARVSSQHPTTRAYLYAFTTNAIGQCGPVLSAAAVVQLALYRFDNAIPPDQEDNTLVAIQPLLGEIDAQRFVRRHGCDGPVTEMFLVIAVPAFLSTM